MLTSNLSSVLNIDDLSARLDEYSSEETISFEDFAQFLVSRLYGQVADSQKSAWTAFEHVCWMVLSAKAPELYVQFANSHESNAERESGFKLWRIFNFLAERDPVQFTVTLPPKLSLEEVRFVDEKLDGLLGITSRPSAAQPQQVSLTGNTEETFSNVEEELLFGALTFAQYARYVRSRFLSALSVTPDDFARAVDELLAQMLDDVVKRGVLGEFKESSGIKFKPGSSVKDRFTVLTRSDFCLYEAAHESEHKAQSEIGSLRHSVVLSDRVHVEALNESSSSKHATQFRFALINDYAKKRLVLVASDLRSRNEWLAAFSLANQHRDCDRSVAAIEAHARLTDRARRRADYQQRIAAARREQLAIEQSIAGLQGQISSLRFQLDVSFNSGNFTFFLFVPAFIAAMTK